MANPTKSKIKTEFELVLKKGIPTDRFGFPEDGLLRRITGVYNNFLKTHKPHLIKMVVDLHNIRQEEILMLKGDARLSKKS